MAWACNVIANRPEIGMSREGLYQHKMPVKSFSKVGPRAWKLGVRAQNRLWNRPPVYFRNEPCTQQTPWKSQIEFQRHHFVTKFQKLKNQNSKSSGIEIETGYRQTKKRKLNLSKERETISLANKAGYHHFMDSISLLLVNKCWPLFLGGILGWVRTEVSYI